MSRTITYVVDLDGVLKTDSDFTGEKAEVLNLNSKQYRYLIRPFALEFLQELKKLGNVIIFTLSSRRYAEHCINKIGAIGVVDAIYPREGIHNLPRLDNFVIMDNNEEIMKAKYDALLKKNFLAKGKEILVPTFEGNPDDTELMNVLEKIKANWN